MNEFCLKVWGDLACFTRPEMKAERVSYDIMTPSAARSIFEAVLWKPAIRWRITKIEILNPIKWLSVLRNEVGSVIPRGTVRTAMTRGVGSLGQYIEEDRQQRASLLLRDVAYLIHGRFDIDSQAKPENTTQKFSEMFRRRANNGQCFNQPYLGCREFAASFELLDHRNDLPEPIDESRDLGWMLYDLNYSDPDNIRPLFFRATLDKGVLLVPSPNSPEVRG